MSDKGMNPFTKDVTYFFFIFIALVVAIVTIYESFRQVEFNRLQREEVLYWKKANLARIILKPFEQDQRLVDAAAMLNTQDFKYDGTSIVSSDIAATFERLSSAEGRVVLSKTNQHIRNSFDFFFKNIKFLEHYLRTSLIDFADIEYPLEITIQSIKCMPKMIVYFARRHKDTLAKAFIDRFEEPQSCN